jgi:hypothetical protein
LLILDGFSGHISISIKDYYLAFDIKLGFLPPHSTHLFQPLDVAVFGPLKRIHQRKLLEALHHTNISFSRTDFVFVLQEILSTGLTRHNIIKGFEETGI